MDDVCDFILGEPATQRFSSFATQHPVPWSFENRSMNLGSYALDLKCASRLAGLITDLMQAFDQSLR